MAADVKVTISGDSKSLEKACDRVGAAAKEMAGDLDKAEGDANRFARAMDKAGGATDASESKFMGTADLLDGLGGAFGLPTEGATNLMRSFGDLSGGFTALSPMIGGVATALTSGLGSAMTFIAAHPMLITLGLLTAAFVLLWKNSETFRDIVKGAFETVGDVIGGVWNWVKDNWPLLLAILTGPIGLAVHQIITHWDTIKNAFTRVKEWIGERVGDVVGFITGIPGRIGGVASTMFDAVKGAMTGAKDWISNRIDDVVGFFTGLPGRLKSAAGGMFDWLQDFFKTAWNTVAGLWNGIEFKLPKVDLGPLGSLGGQTIGMPDLPRFHQGGVVPGSPGEPVPIMAMAGETVMPRGAAAPVVVNVYVSGSVVAENELVDAIHEGLLRKQRRTPLGLAS